MTWLPTHRICQHESHAILDYIIFASKALHNSQIAIKSAYFTALLFSLIESVQTFAQSRAWSVFNSKLCDRVWHALSKKRGLGILLQLMTSCLTVSDFRGEGGMPSWPRTDLDLWGAEHWLANTTQTFLCDTWEVRILPGQRRVLPKPTK